MRGTVLTHAAPDHRARGLGTASSPEQACPGRSRTGRDRSTGRGNAGSRACARSWARASSPESEQPGDLAQVEPVAERAAADQERPGADAAGDDFRLEP